MKSQLQNAFNLKDLSNLKYFLGLEIAYSKNGILLSQRKYCISLLEYTGFLCFKSAPLPMDPNHRLSADEGDLLTDDFVYQRIIGRLLYLTLSRLDITYAVHKLSQYLSKLRLRHLYAAQHLLRYLKGTVGRGLFFSSKSSLTLKACADPDWGNCPDTHRSISRYCVFIGDSMISWKSEKQPAVSHSSAEAEHRALATVASEITWLTSLLIAFHIHARPAMLFRDSQAAIHIASNPSFHEQTKHMDIDCHFVLAKVSAGLLKLVNVRTCHQLADLLTKALPAPQFHVLLSKNVYFPS